MKTKEELNALKEEVEAVNKKLAELTDEELAQVTGGVDGLLNVDVVPTAPDSSVYPNRPLETLETREEGLHLIERYIEQTIIEVEPGRIITIPYDDERLNVAKPISINPLTDSTLEMQTTQLATEQQNVVRNQRSF